MTNTERISKLNELIKVYSNKKNIKDTILTFFFNFIKKTVFLVTSIFSLWRTFDKEALLLRSINEGYEEAVNKYKVNEAVHIAHVTAAKSGHLLSVEDTLTNTKLNYIKNYFNIPASLIHGICNS